MYVKPTKWPSVIGTLSVVFGTLGVLGIVVMAFVGPGPDPGRHRDQLLHIPAWYQGVVRVHGLLTSGLLLWAGVALRRRNPLGRTLHVVYVLLVLAVNVFALAVLGKAAADYPGGTMLPVAMLCVGTLGSAYPIFVLVWLMRPSVRREVAVWRERAAARRRRMQGHL